MLSRFALFFVVVRAATDPPVGRPLATCPSVRGYLTGTSHLDEGLRVSEIESCSGTRRRACVVVVWLCGGTSWLPSLKQIYYIIQKNEDNHIIFVLNINIHALAQI